MLYWLIALFHLVVMPVAALHALVSKRDHRAALGWIGGIVIFSIAAPVIYFFFGINRLRSRSRLFAAPQPFITPLALTHALLVNRTFSSGRDARSRLACAGQQA